MTLERRVEALATTVAQQQATIVQMQVVIADMQGTSGAGWRLRANGDVSLGDAGVFGGTVTAAPNEAAKTHEEIFNEKLDLIISLMPPLKL
ncbi:hypothetical protein [Leclercia adecarboxylata]|uniref:hypothetical protein n=1 Tax=Leclercia adecarboxylata TaxID=83655 RepID=UPI00111B6C26|nr:hypothetical protein [Leclercia adecarboxylata]QCZ29159.1 hypothetical protein FHN83_22040 [Leclercia adecarboxylata]